MDIKYLEQVLKERLCPVPAEVEKEDEEVTKSQKSS